MTSEALHHLRAVDPTLAAVIDAVGPFAPRRREPSFAALVSAIVSQQISTQAAAAIERRLEALVGGRPTPEALLTTPEDKLRAAGLSRAKLAAVRDVAARAVAGDLVIERFCDLDDETIIAQLCRSRGVGRWTAEMVLIFALGREDILPVGDHGFRVAVRRLYGEQVDVTPAGLRALAEPWRPYRSVATWYLWQSLALPSPR